MNIAHIRICKEETGLSGANIGIQNSEKGAAGMNASCELLLFIAYNLANQNQIISRDALELNLEWADWEDVPGKTDVASGIAWLVANDYLAEAEQGYDLTALGQKEGSRLNRERTKADFNQKIKRYTASDAYLDYCEELYGYRMYLFNMMDKAQLDYLFQAVPLAAADTVLDLGCGSGGILNRLVAQSGCRGVGIDQLDPDITPGKLFTYICGDLDNLSEYHLQPNITLSIDSLYFSQDLNRLLSVLKSMKNNRLYLFYSQYLFDEGVKDKSILDPDHTRLAQALQRRELDYRTVNFSANEQDLYENGIRILPRYQKAFAGEGNPDLYEAKHRENKGGKELYDKGLAGRYLYIVP